MKKKLVSMMLLLAMTLTACGNGGENTSADSKAGEVEETASVEEVSSETAPAKEVELNIMMSFPQYMDQWEDYCDQFEAKMLAEENVKVTINLEMPSADQYDSILQARLTGDDTPDLFTIQANNIQTYANAGYLTDLTNEESIAKVYDNVKETVTVDGKVMGVPIESTAWSVLYNKQMFEDAGITPPETLDELKAVCVALQEKGYTPFMLAFQEQWVPQLMTAVTLGGKTTGDIPDWLERMYKDEASYEEVREIFDVINLIMENGTKRAMEEGSEVGAADFANGAAAMFVQGTWSANTIMTTNPDMQLGVFALPVNNNPECTRINLATSTVLGVYANGLEKEVAIKFANYVLDDNDSSALFQACGFNPISSIHAFETASWVQDAYKYVEEGRSYQDLVLPSSVTDEQGRLLQELYVGSVDIDGIIERLDGAFKEANELSK
ncbi:raffinose/stachyose/melibiose transport system substrate-binding protein [Kineothrix alysoides]|uniref:Raffinose/stachyose/melibiose transport system substrate-binding protein n=1 Tax=Kineothrix alysoides TaxID=1469948 RepID=A0A4R1QXL0_9FIRM|nr:extracellular solute-binding protein [Kineothrix alysoides]TCL55870.1 raffinose/stachyose/melibiose transport system substrate-binding protein [Kineothrix alysoides]